MDNQIYSFNKIRKDIEVKVDEQLRAILETTSDIDEITSKIDLNKIENEVCKKYGESEQLTDTKFLIENEDLWASLWSADFEDYDEISRGLTNLKNNSIQILDKLLAVYIIDTKNKSWKTLAKDLQQCMISAKDEVFEKCLKVHYKMIATSVTSNDGYLNLIHTLILIFNNNYKSSLEVCEHDKIRKRAVSIFKLLLKSQQVLFKNWLHIKQKSVEEIIITFVYLLNQSVGNKHDLNALDVLAALDPKAEWFRKFCYGVQTRNIILSCLKKTPNWLVYFFDAIVNHLEENTDYYGDYMELSHSTHFLLYFLTYKQNLSIFPVKVRVIVNSLTFEHFISIVITKINDWIESRKREVLVEFLKGLLTNHLNLILNLDIRKRLFEQFIINQNKLQLSLIVERNLHVVEIANCVFKSHYSKIMLYRLIKKYKRNSSNLCDNIFQIIINVTISCIRSFIKDSGMEIYINNTLFNLVDCCVNIFSSHVQAFIAINTSRLMITLRDLYKTVLNRTVNSIYYTSRIATYLCFFIENDCATIKTLENESGLLNEIVWHALANTDSLTSVSSLNSKLVLSISGYEAGMKVIEDNHDLFVKRPLTRVWHAEIDRETSASSFEHELYRFLLFLSAVSYNLHAVKALLGYENENTIVEDQERPLILAELIENSLDLSSMESIEIVLGLQAIRVLITNADVLLYLQNRYNLQENLIELQVNSQMSHSQNDDSPENVANILIDECSSLRHYILLYIKYINTIDITLNEKLLNQARLVVAPYQSSSALTRFQRATNEFQKFVYDSKGGLHDHNWTLQARKAFRISCKEKYKTTLVQELIDQIPKTASHRNFNWPPINSTLPALFPEEHRGVTVVVRFGIQNGILHASVQNEDNLILLLKQSRAYLSYEPKEFAGFDWFVSVVFLICAGNVEKCKNTLTNVASTTVVPIIWPAAAQGIDKKNRTQFYYQLEIVMDDTSKVSQALRSLGVSVRHVAQKWLSHSFFTVLDFKEICNFFIIAVLYPPEYILFFIVAVFNHISSDIYAATHTTNIVANLKITKCLDFHVANYFNLMDKLFKQYKNVLQL